MQAIIMNRIGDWGFSLGLFSIYLIFGNLDLITTFSLAPMINSNLLDIITLFLFIGAMAKSAQIGLHGWLPNAMEGKILLILYIYNFNIYFYINYIHSI